VARNRASAASSRPRRPGTCGAKACVKGPGAASSRIYRCAPSRATLSLAPAAETTNLQRISASSHYVMVPSVSFESRVIELRDRTKVHLRPIRPEDEALLHEAVAAMSERTVYFRFFSPIKRMSDALAHRLAVVDYKDRFALVATTHRPNGKERIVGVARYDRAPDTDVAEVAVAVIDEFQRRGLGTLLLAELARVAKNHGIKMFQLIVLPENREMLDLLRKMGWIHQARLTGGVYEISFDLPEPA